MPHVVIYTTVMLKRAELNIEPRLRGSKVLDQNSQVLNVWNTTLKYNQKKCVIQKKV
jgi:hypothetical protein